MPKPPVNPKKLLTKLATAVRKQRLALGWSQDRLAEESGLTRNFISLIECGEGNPSIVKLAMIAKALDLTLPELLKDI